MDGVTFTSSEQAYMWLKSEDPVYRRAILAEHNPGRCKRLGNAAVLPDDWDERSRYDAMFKVILAKFRSSRRSRELLLGTEFAYLEESNFHGDTHWGASASTHVGKNHLGRQLMCAREIFRKELL